jgi:outer membrane lipoprotein LolB
MKAGSRYRAPMRSASGWHVALAGAAALLLAACAAPVRRAADSAELTMQSQREAVLAQQTHWSLSGRIAVSDGKDGGSGRIDWRQRGEKYVIDLRAPVSRQTWRLSGSQHGARLDGLEGGPREDADAQALLQREVGWSLPVDDLVAWARGGRGRGAAQIEFDADGRPARIEQRGWIVEYRAWAEGDPILPRKVFATNGQRRVRLIVERWDVGAARQ